MQLEKVYEPQQCEPRWSQFWIDEGVFTADATRPGKRFSIVIPPPNVTGALHMGHMLEHTVMDTAVRWHRMLGENVLWLPGVDHAGIATQMVVERKLAEEGITRHQVGREEFERRVWEWKEQYGNRITQQMRQIGDSVDWTRERFTLSPELSRAVREAFVRLYEKGLIYRGEYMVNWCPRCRTAISDLEVVHEETQGSLWHIRYPVHDSDRVLTVATTRPETMLGDTAVAVNPSDDRYSDLRGKTVMLPLMNREIPVIFDAVADPLFGTGVVKVTPAHDPNDLEAGKRHQLPLIRVIGLDGKMTEAAGAYAGLDRFVARKRVVADLEALGLLEEIEPHVLSIGKCQRCGTIAEPLVSTQWFVKTKPLAAKAIGAAEDGRLEFNPGNWTKIFFDWMHNIRDWCISRQLWWGHRIPAWHCSDCQQITVARETPVECAHCKSARIEQDPDVLDTWFSSGLWPFSTMGWPDDTADMRAYYPTSLLITGFDILFFWVARMVMMGMELTGEVPFAVVHMHGLVRDADRQKMSKTKGNAIDPLEVNGKYGTDAVRLSLLLGAAPGTDIAFTDERVLSARAFGNKIWNAARFIFSNMERSGVEPAVIACGKPEALEDRWIVSRFQHASGHVGKALEQHRYHEAADSLYHFFWDDFCDWYLEIKKLRFTENSGLSSDWRVLLGIFEAYLRLLHPVMPFLTEELWQRLKGHSADQPLSIALAHFPQCSEFESDPAAERDMTLLQEMIVAARTLRADRKLDRKQLLDGLLYCRDGACEVAASQIDVLEKLANVKLDVRLEAAPKLEGAVRSTAEFDLLLHVPEANRDEQRGRLQREIDQLLKLLTSQERQLGNERFLSNAPPAVVQELRGKRSEYEAQLAKTRAALVALGS